MVLVNDLLALGQIHYNGKERCVWPVPGVAQGKYDCI